MTTRGRILRLRVTAPDEDILREFLRTRRLDVSGGVRRTGGVVSIDAYVPETEVDSLTSPSIEIEVVDDATATGLARQAEVGMGNRFAERSAVPRGLGRKTGRSEGGE